ncbi:hypothetical protein M7I_8275 [Glarea lozoyensis 74030]|uniref:SAP domain-containing protein n=1 Tax=Glarea lozoyensis (strain ATCC 74030 / MF5533) TaxID=1104152 RepID=H0EZK1_GLAL7|nr:hypothetical protein M7I_8275 [Glarea lozoyensis 74030]
MTKRKAVQQVEEAGNDYDNGGVQGPIDDKTDDFSNLTVPQLKYELELRGLRRSGRKAELLARLLEHAETCRQQEPQTKRARTQSQHPALTENNVIDLEDEDVTFDVAGFGGEQRLRPFVEAPDAKFKDKLKRIQKDHALIKILKAPPQLCYQQAFLSTELELIFANAPVTQAPVFEPHKHIEDDSLHNRKPPPGTLAGLKAIAPKLGSYQNVAHLMSQYQELEKPHDKNDDLVGYEYDYD